MYKNLENLADSAEGIIESNLLPRKERQKPKKKITETIKEAVAPMLQPAPVVNVTTDNKDVIRAVKGVGDKIKVFNSQPLLNAIYQVSDAILENKPDFAPLITAVQNAKTVVDLKPISDALQALRDDRADGRITELADRIEKALSDLGSKMPSGGGGNTGRVTNRAGAVVNPSTEEKQDAIVAAIENISIPAPVGGATEAKQDDIITAIGAIPGGGGVQYTEGDTDATITGTALMWEDAGNALVVASATKPLPVSASIDTTGLATSAKQDTLIGHLDGVETVLGTIDADTGVLAGAVTAGKVQAEVTNTVAVSGAFYQATQPVSIASMPSTPVTGTFWQATQPVSIAATVAVTDNAGSLTVDNSGTFAVQAAQSGTWTVQPGNTANTTAWLVNDAPVTTGGLSKFHLVGAAATNATNVKASAGQVYAITAFNIAATPAYLKFHNTAGTPTAGSGVTDTYLIPGNTAGAGVAINIDKGITFSTGIGITLVTGITDASAVAVAADNVVVNIYYK